MRQNLQDTIYGITAGITAAFIWLCALAVIGSTSLWLCVLAWDGIRTAIK